MPADTDKETSMVYEEPIEIPLENDDDDDDDDEEEEEEEDDGAAASGSEDETSENRDRDTVGNDGVARDEEDGDDNDSTDEAEDKNRNKRACTKSSRSGDRSDIKASSVDMENDGKSDSIDGTNNDNRNYVLPGKKVPERLLEKRRLGRLKAAEEFARKLKAVGVERKDDTTLPPTGHFQTISAINLKNYSSDYLRKDEQAFAIRDRKSIRSSTASTTNAVPSTATTTNTTPEVPDLKPNGANAHIRSQTVEDLDYHDPKFSIIIQPGGDTIKIGYAKDSTPQMIPNCVAVPRVHTDDRGTYYTSKRSQLDDEVQFEEVISDIKMSFRERMRYYKRKYITNGNEQVLKFNQRSEPKTISSQIDPDPIQWITDTSKAYYGDEALRCPEDKFIIRSPFVSGGFFNLSSPDYQSLAELLTDISRLIEHSLAGPDLGLKRSSYNQYRVVLIVPDLFSKSHLERFIQILLGEMNFKAIAIMQESLSTCYGAGMSSPTCVVNIGASQTHISCVDEGVLIDNTSIALDFGSDDVTRLYAELLKKSSFPLKDWDIGTQAGWNMAEDLKMDTVTYSDIDITIKIINAFYRVAGQDTKQIEFQVYEEVILAVIAFFFPKAFQLLQNEATPIEEGRLYKFLPVSRDYYNDSLNDNRSLAQVSCLDESNYCNQTDERILFKSLVTYADRVESLHNNKQTEHDERLNYIPLDQAIVESITNACLATDMSRSPQFYENILVVGGGSKIPAFDTILKDRITLTRPKMVNNKNFANFHKKVAKEIKDAQNNIKNNNPVVNPEDQTKIDELIQEKVQEIIENNLSKYLTSISRHLQSNAGNVSETGNDANITSINEQYSPVKVLPTPRDMDPTMVCWKGGCVLAQIKLAEELFVSSYDWDIHGSRILQHKCIFTY